MSATNLDYFTWSPTSDGSSPAGGQPINYGATITVTGSLGGGTLYLDLKDAFNNWIQYSSSINTSPSCSSFSGLWTNNYRLRLVGSTAPTAHIQVTLNDNGQ